MTAPQGILNRIVEDLKKIDKKPLHVFLKSRLLFRKCLSQRVVGLMLKSIFVSDL